MVFGFGGGVLTSWAMRILIVAGALADRCALQGVVAPLGCEVECVTAVTEIAESDIDAFDVVLAVGVDPLSGVRGLSRRVMILSPSREEQAVLGALEQGVNQYLSLPVEPCRLRRKLRPTR